MGVEEGIGRGEEKGKEVGGDADYYGQCMKLGDDKTKDGKEAGSSERV